MEIETLSPAQLEKQKQVDAFITYLKYVQNGDFSLKATEITMFKDFDKDGISGLSNIEIGVLNSKLDYFKNNIASFINIDGTVGANYDLNGDNNAANDIANLSYVLNRRSITSEEQAATVKILETKGKSLPVINAYKQLANSMPSSAANFLKLVDQGLSDVSLVTFSKAMLSPADFNINGIIGQANMGYSNLLNQKASKEMIEGFTNLLLNGVDGKPGPEEGFDHIRARLEYMNLLNMKADIDVPTALAVTTLAGKMSAGLINYEARGISGGHGLRILIDNGVNTASNETIKKYCDFVFANPKLDANAYDAYAKQVLAESLIPPSPPPIVIPDSLKDASDTIKTLYADLARLDAGAAQHFIKLYTLKVSDKTLDTFAKAMINPRQFDIGSLQGFADEAYRNLITQNANANIIDGFTELLLNGADGQVGLENNFNHVAARQVYVKVTDIKEDISTPAATALANLLGKMYAQEVGLPAVGQDPNSGVYLLLYKNLHDASNEALIIYARFAIAHPDLHAAAYNSFTLLARAGANDNVAQHFNTLVSKNSGEKYIKAFIDLFNKLSANPSQNFRDSASRSFAKLVPASNSTKVLDPTKLSRQAKRLEARKASYQKRLDKLPTNSTRRKGMETRIAAAEGAQAFIALELAS
jgi:hypothetical protein